MRQGESKVKDSRSKHHLSNTRRIRLWRDPKGLTHTHSHFWLHSASSGICIITCHRKMLKLNVTLAYMFPFKWSNGAILQERKSSQEELLGCRRCVIGSLHGQLCWTNLHPTEQLLDQLHLHDGRYERSGALHRNMFKKSKKHFCYFWFLDSHVPVTAFWKEQKWQDAKSNKREGFFRTNSYPLTCKSSCSRMWYI